MSEKSTFLDKILQQDTKILQILLKFGQNGSEREKTVRDVLSLEEFSLEAYFYHHLLNFNENPNLSCDLFTFDDLVSRITTCDKLPPPTIWKIFALVAAQTNNLNEKIIKLIDGIDCPSEKHLKILKIVLEISQDLKSRKVITFLLDQLQNENRAMKIIVVDCLEILLQQKFGSVSILSGIWSKVFNDQTNENLFVLGHLMSFYIADRGFDLFAEDIFWRRIYDACKSKDNFVRKNALSILKQIVAEIDKIPSNTWIKTKIGQDQASWNIFFNIMETLDDSHSHLVLPALNLIDRTDELGMIWKILLLELVLSSNSVKIVSWGVEYTLKYISVTSDQLDDMIYGDFVEVLLRAFNSITITDEMPNRMACYSFFVECSHKILSSTVEWNCDALSLVTDVVLHAVTNKICQKSLVTYFDLKKFMGKVASCPIIIVRRKLHLNVLRIFENLSGMLTDSQALNCLQLLYNIDQEKPVLYRLYCRNDDNYVNQRQLSIDDVFKTPGCTPEFVNYVINYESELNGIIENDFALKLKLIEEQCFLPLKEMLREGDWKFINSIKKSIRLWFEKKRIDAFIPILSCELLYSLNFLQILRQLVASQISSDPTFELLKRLNPSSTNAETTQLLSAPNPTALANAFILMNNTVDLGISQWNINLFDLDEMKRIFEIFSSDLPEYRQSNFGHLVEYLKKELATSHRNYSIDCDFFVHMCNEMIELGVVDESWDLFAAIVTAYPLKVKTMDMNILIDFVHLYLDEIFMYRKRDQFYKATHRFFEVILSPKLFEGANWRKRIFESSFRRYRSEILRSFDVAGSFFSGLLSNSLEFLVEWNDFYEVLQNGLLYTATPQNAVRNICVKFLSEQILSNGGTQLKDGLVARLIAKSDEMGRSKPRYYANSQHHRLKLRVIQNIALLLTSSPAIGSQYNSHLWDILSSENNQLNITYILELTIAQTIDELNFRALLQSPISYKSPNLIQSLMVIAYLKCLIDEDVELTKFVIDYLFEWTMGQNFITRLYSQITIAKLMEFFKLDVQPEYQIIAGGIRNSLTNGSNTAEHNIEKLRKDFRYNNLNPTCENFASKSNIFYHIPRITEMPMEEWIEFKEYSTENDLLGKCDKVWAKVTKTVETIDISVENLENMQKKIIPIKQTIPETLSDTKNIFDDKTSSGDGLIVVASLVSRNPNLGGLARSCEIFGVKKFVLDTLKSADHIEFQTLSMSAEKWLPLVEVKSWQLREYLIAMKQNGYTIVGAEQTAKSQPIGIVKFPKNTIVLLGHEKEGIPANLLSLLDIPVEIPQFGVVRSLNVHVTGAIFMWEYAKQQLIK